MWATPSPPWAANPPPGQTRYENNPPDISASIIGLGVFCTTAALIVVFLRLYTRIFIVRGLKSDDYLMILAMGFLVAFFAISVRLTVYGVGHHVWDVRLTDYSPGILQLAVFAEIIGCLMISFNKLSVLSLYTFLTPNKKFRAAVYGLMAFVVTFTVVFILVELLECQPVQAQWDLALVYSGATCLTASVPPLMVLSIVNMFVDAAVVLIPLPIILPLPIPKKDKISCLLLFAAGGGLVCVAAIGRTVELMHLLQDDALIDVTWLMVPEVNWAFAEGSVGIIAASIPCIKPLFQRLMTKVYGEGNKEGDISGVTLQNLSEGSTGQRAHRHHHWPHSKDRTLTCNPGDEELGLCPCRDTHGSDSVSKTSDNAVSSTAHRNEARPQGGHLKEKADASGRIEVTMADFTVAH